MDEIKIKSRMEPVIDLFKDDIATIRTGRATPALIEEIEVSVYKGHPREAASGSAGERMKLKQLGAIQVADARTLTFQPWDVSIIKEIKNGILASGSGLTPVVDANIIRISLPVLTTEQRGDYLRLLGKKAEAAKIMIRDIRGEERYQLQEQLKQKQISEDEFHRQEERLQKITDEYVDRVDEIAAKKEREIRGEE